MYMIFLFFFYELQAERRRPASIHAAVCIFCGENRWTVCVLTAIRNTHKVY